jgi:acetyl-CoA decarbonylase/synthase complex subunit delta
MERLRIAAIQQKDETIALPIICNLGKEIWKSQEAKLQNDTDSEIGVMMEICAGVSLLLAGANLLILSHPKSLRILNTFIEKMLIEQ